MKYKVGDRVRIKDIDWYNKNKNKNKNKSKSHGTVACGGKYFDYDMREWCGKTMTIIAAHETCYSYIMKEDGRKHFWTDEMIECKVEEKETLLGWVKESDNLRLVPHKDYEIKHDGNNFYLVKKKKEYPKTYEECCKVLGVNPDNFLSIRNLYRDDGDEESTDYERDLLGKFDSLWELRICRDAYWKIAGEEMGLGKPWEPDWNTSEPKYVIACTSNGIEKQWETTYCKGFAFPTEEMRDAFKENFNKELEICKELL